MAETYKHLDDAKHDDLDRALNAALAKYAAVEPRAGLEERVLANLRAERARVPDRAWWRWSAAAALTAVVVVAVTLSLRSGRPTQPVVKHTPATTQSPHEPERLAANGEANSVRPQAHKPNHRTLARSDQPKAVVATAIPKLDQFPSPQPLSEQERILTSYVVKYPENAALLAEARMEALRRDAEERRQLAAGDRDSQE